MDVHDGPRNAPLGDPRPARPERAPSRRRVGEALGEWQAGEVRVARRFPQCRGLSSAQLEDLYQETALALLNRRFYSEEHLRNALRLGLRHRALHVHRDERRRGEILYEHAPEAHRAALARTEQEHPEQALLAHEDGLVVLEFASELTELEQRVYGLEAEGLRYRAIAPIIGVAVNEARKASRGVQAKRERFQLLYDTGRLCGYRAPTIRALLAGEETSEQLARAAFAHLKACSHCRDEHKTNAARLQRGFQQRAAALLPAPLLAGHVGWLARLDLRLRLALSRMGPNAASAGPGAVRERALALATTGGVSAKLAAAGATVAVIAGGTIGATHELSQPRPRAKSGHDHARALVRQRSAGERRSDAVIAASEAAPVAPVTRVTRSVTRAPARKAEREPGGFAFLGVPQGSASHASAAHAASTAGSPGEHVAAPAPAHHESEQQSGGGQFSP